MRPKSFTNKVGERIEDEKIEDTMFVIMGSEEEEKERTRK